MTAAQARHRTWHALYDAAAATTRTRAQHGELSQQHQQAQLARVEARTSFEAADRAARIGGVL